MVCGCVVMFGLVFVLLVIGIVFVVFSGGFVVVFGVDVFVVSVEIVMVMLGDMFWLIVSMVVFEVDLCDVIGEISCMNFFYGGELQIGQELVILVQYMN